MTSTRERLARAQRRVHTLLGMLAEYERRREPNPALIAVTRRGLRAASRELADVACLTVVEEPRSTRKRRSKWEVSADAAA